MRHVSRTSLPYATSFTALLPGIQYPVREGMDVFQANWRLCLRLSNKRIVERVDELFEVVVYSNILGQEEVSRICKLAISACHLSATIEPATFFLDHSSSEIRRFAPFCQSPLQSAAPPWFLAYL